MLDPSSPPDCPPFTIYVSVSLDLGFEEREQNTVSLLSLAASLRPVLTLTPQPPPAPKRVGMPAHSSHVKECSQRTGDGCLFFPVVNILTCTTRCLHWATRFAWRWTWLCTHALSRTELAWLQTAIITYLCKQIESWSVVAQQTRVIHMQVDPPPFLHH